MNRKKLTKIFMMISKKLSMVDTKYFSALKVKIQLIQGPTCISPLYQGTDVHYNDISVFSLTLVYLGFKSNKPLKS